ncbi:DNA gyrase subunit A [Methanosarcina sp. 2.H.T.1A.6]|uniref:DNA gyrase subunit A n=1 Tax=unclassified Methanosarcina TaxID=2644672 RepID=UPI000621A100|nr:MULTISPECIES: DNA gyrase subunit A [unclassified Methanosarcina]KKG09783.1 DNA gyrase subunit A [Methanosarcina sp. 2.H.T.1A.15]KKG18488.1 DNA gyrase subunit A [Methanosarcina sp. 2.H.T.1A.3]KKG21143.1 DNA gyrase subunit A [Methanosarcina sp. 2.H.T.1A.8]KKG22343.1 DNA gyrase subunit A [Methanosarcina sp. 2.H.T.1A.6]
MAEREDENKSEAELKKSYQTSLIPEGTDEDPEVEEEVSSLTSGEPDEKPGLEEQENGADPAPEEPDEEPERTGVTSILIEDEMKRSYINYAMSVIVGRALPDARDGLKPVHRRILFSMKEAGITHDKSYKKSARIVGDVLGKYHPHGDTAVYDSIVRMVQTFSLRYPLIDGQGNFGSIDGDSAAAMRYTEVRMDRVAEEMLADIDKETVPFRPNYDGSLEEPEVLPAKLPNLLINGSTGIAVGMATNMAPHNLREVIDGTLMLIENPETSVSELMTVVKGPDFPTGAHILGTAGIRSAFTTGRGPIKIRAVAEIQELKKDRQQIIVTELPYQVNKSRLIENIAQLAREKVIVGISDLRDESDRDGIRVVVELSRGANANVILNQLYKHTQMETSFGVINLALVDGKPKELNLKQLLEIYLTYRMEIIQKRTLYDLRKSEERAHLLEGLRIALDNIDEVVALIKGSANGDEAKQGLINDFALDEVQAKAILDMRLQRLTGLETQKILEELESLVKVIAELRKILESDELKYEIIRTELLEIRGKYGDARRTKIVQYTEDVTDEDLIPEEDVVVTITSSGYIKRIPLDTYTMQRRGGRGIIGMETKEEDFVENLFISSTHNYILFFTNRGRLYWQKVYEIPEGSRQSRGKAIVNLLELQEGEMVNAMIPAKKFAEDRYLLMATRAGTIKKTPLSEFRNPRKAGIIAVSLDEGDELVKVLLTEGKQEIVMVSKKGKAIRFSEENVRPMGRTARGVRGMTLDGPDDEVVSMDLVDETTTLLTVTEKGFGKRTEYSQYPAHRRGGKGVITIVTNLRNGPVSNVESVAEDDELMFTSAEGIIIRIPANGISVQGRNTQGVRIMNIKPGDKVVGMARIKAEDEEERQLKLTNLRARKAEQAGETIEDSEDEVEDVEELEDFEELEDVEEKEEVEEDKVEEKEEN